MITDTERRWIEHAMAKVSRGEVSSMATAKVWRTIAAIFDRAAQRIEDDLVDKVDARLYNTNTENKERDYA